MTEKSTAVPIPELRTCRVSLVWPALLRLSVSDHDTYEGIIKLGQKFKIAINIRALIIRIGFWEMLYHTYNKERPKSCW